MLASLRSIVHEVNSARSLSEVLDIIVQQVREAMQAGVCSVYLFDESDQRYVLMATQGLRPESVGKVRLAAREGLVGLVAAREEPLNLENADQHPSFAFFEETGERIFHSFLGAPIIHHRKVLGVLVLQQETQRRFQPEEEAFVVTVCAQLSGAIAHAGATGALLELAQRGRGRSRETTFIGIPSAPGIGIGRVVLVAQEGSLGSVPERYSSDSQAELLRLQRALAAAAADMRKLGSGLEAKLSSEELGLFEVYIRLLDDRTLIGEVEAAIEAGQTAQSAWASVMQRHVRTFRKMDDAYLRDRAADIDDLGRRVLGYLQRERRESVPLPRRIVLVGEELSATTLADIPINRLAGMVSVRGSSNSHMAIIGRALGIPTVMGAVDLPWPELEGHELVVDGFRGDVITQPSRAVRRTYVGRQREEKLLAQDLAKLTDQPCVTTDGQPLALWVNTGLRQESRISKKVGAEAVGLYRTEISFFARNSFPTEDEQVATYRQQLRDFAPRPVTMRTLDIGGDKALPYFPIEEANPFLGWRGIRISLDHPDIFLTQIRAMLRASAGFNNLRILLPMISNIPELEQALALIDRAYAELTQEEGYQLQPPKVGAMIEVPAAVYQVRDIGRRVDFLSVGTNDLTQYLLAVDRNNPRVADLYHTMHPAVLRALQTIREKADSVGCELSVCGEMAGDPLGAVLLLGLGYQRLSMSASSLLRVKSMLSQVSHAEAKALVKRAMRLSDAGQVRQLFIKRLDRPELTKLYRPLLNL
ncbi:MAG: phosphoenolpyruvate--protein phosphotransferase [Porticoccaceae bacterium]